MSCRDSSQPLENWKDDLPSLCCLYFPQLWLGVLGASCFPFTDSVLYVKSCAYIRSSWSLADGWILSLTLNYSVSQRSDGLHSALRLALSTVPLHWRTVRVIPDTTVTYRERLRCANTGACLSRVGEPWVWPTLRLNFFLGKCRA